jgi:hypothetical protein
MVVKKFVEGESAVKPTKRKMTAREREELLIENFVGLQQAMTNLSIKFGGLSDNISKLLEVFEDAAKSFVKDGKTDDKEMLNKINVLIDQNKTIARGLVLMEGKLSAPTKSEKYSSHPPSSLVGQSPKPKPLPIR